MLPLAAHRYASFLLVASAAVATGITLRRLNAEDLLLAGFACVAPALGDLVALAARRS